MKIIKYFNDYYDSAIGIDGIDETCIYDRKAFLDADKYIFTKNRKLFEVPSDSWKDEPFRTPNRKSQNKIGLYSIVPFIVGFCGKTYVGYVFRYYTGFGSEDKIKIAYGYDEFLSTAPIKDKYVYNHAKTGELFVYKDELKGIKRFMDMFHEKDHSELFVKNDVPTFVYDFGTELSSLPLDKSIEYVNKYGRTAPSGECFIYNPCLNDYQFYKVFNSAHAFQEIQMYKQGVLGAKEKESAPLSDKEKILQHGFDTVWSFRNPCPPKRKKGRCK